MLFASLSSSLLALGGLASAAVVNRNQLTSYDGITLFAYGTNLNGIPVFYSNGLMFAGQTNPGWGGIITNITFSTTSSSLTSPWTISANLTNEAYTTAPFVDDSYSLYIVPTSGSFEQVGFLSNDDNSSSTVPTNATTTGFTWYGTSVCYAASSSNYELNFWANATNTTGIFSVHWNSEGTAQGSAFPISIKSTFPTRLS